MRKLVPSGTLRLAWVALCAGACTDRPAVPASAALDVEELVEERRLAFREEQEAAERAQMRQRAPLRDVFAARPTVVAFHPGPVLDPDTAGTRERLERYEWVAGAAGWVFEERHSGTLQVLDSRSQALYSIAVPPESLGIILAAPGQRPQLWFGRIDADELEGRLRMLREWLPGGTAPGGTRL